MTPLRTPSDVAADVLISPGWTKTFDRLAEDCSYAYGREHLARLDLILWPADLEDFSVAGTEFVIARIVERLATTKALGLNRHWSYKGDRHLGLLTAFKAERRRLSELVSDRNGKGIADLIQQNLVEKMGAGTLEAVE